MANDEDTKIVENILHLNDDCLIQICKMIPLIDLCAMAETCKRFQYVAREVFQSKHKSCGISGNGEVFRHHRRVLKNFGHLVTEIVCITRMFHIGISDEQMKTVFRWVKRYCGEALEKVTVISAEEIILPISAIQMMAGLKQIHLMAPVTDENLRAVFLNCKKVVDLKLATYDGPFHFPDYRFLHLRTLTNRVRVGSSTDYNHIETFFKHHTALTKLETQFLSDLGPDGVIDLSFMKHLTNLTELHLTLCYSKIVGIDAFCFLKNLREFSIDGSSDKRTDGKILENLASIDSLVKLSLGFPDISHLIAGIGRFKNLSKLEVTANEMGPNEIFAYANIASLAHLTNSSCTELQVSCVSLLEPESLVNIVHNLKELKTIELFCGVALSETICRKLAKVCSSQRRKIDIILGKEDVDDMDFDFNFIDKFNKEFGAFVEVKIL